MVKEVYRVVQILLVLIHGLAMKYYIHWLVVGQFLGFGLDLHRSQIIRSITYLVCLDQANKILDVLKLPDQ